MKILQPLCWIILVIFNVLISCEGPMGQQGEQGPQGDSWQPDNSIVSDYQPAISSWLPIIKIDTVGNVGIDQKKEWIPASYILYDNNGNILLKGATGIRGRGNSTWGMPKKPYNINLDKATSLLGMPAHKRWSLLANFADKSLLRTDIAFNKLAAIFDNLAWTPRSQHVDLYLNGSYRGVYQLTESIKVDVNRVNINPTISASNANGGYLLEVCERMEDTFNFRSTQGVAFNCSSPDSKLDTIINGTSVSIFEKIKEFVQKAEDALYGDGFSDPLTGWQKYLDIDSFVDWYLINEITKNNDAIFFSSVYMYYDPVKEKLLMGPIWDFDISMGNINYNGNENPFGFWIKNAKWIERLFQDKAFVIAVKSRWKGKYDQLSNISSYIDTRAASLYMAQSHNFSKWLILDKQVWPNAIVIGSYDGEISYLKSYLTTRIAWLNKAINEL